MSVNRLPAEAPNQFGGSEIHRGRPIRFRLDERQIEGFAGDTVLSAALAAGINEAGRRGREPLALDEYFAPPVTIAGGPPLPMARTPAVDGLHYRTTGATRSSGWTARLGNLFRRETNSLGLQFEATLGGLAPWRLLPPGPGLSADLLVIGGGVAGMAAALAARPKDAVILLERHPTLGGTARFFGGVEGEEQPETAVARLREAVERAPNIRVLTQAEAFTLSPSAARVHQVELVNGRPMGKVFDIAAPRIVLATGAAERLPIFAGNRLPGVVGAVTAFLRAERHGVWLGKRALINTSHGFGYRLALRAQDAGVAVQRIIDTRVDPRSRFIDFCKATGITMAAGQAASHAALLPKSGGLRVGFALAIEEVARDGDSLETEQLVVTGNWQPRLELWVAAGGEMHWDQAQLWLSPAGGAANIVLAGAAAGQRGNAACIESGQQAIARLAGKPVPPIAEPVFDPLYESPDRKTPVGRLRESARSATFLDTGPSLFTRLDAAIAQHGLAQATAPAQVLSLGDVAAAVETGAIPPQEAGAIARERCVAADALPDSGWRVPEPPPIDDLPPIPAYLGGRFGPRPQRCIIAVADSRFFEPGLLIFDTPDSKDPLAAIGVIYAPAPGGRSGGLAILARAPEAADATLYVRDPSGSIAVKVLERLKAERG